MIIKQKKKKELIEQILNKTVSGESYIAEPSRYWKSIVLQQFNRIHNEEMSINELLIHLQEKGVIFKQSNSLVKYPIYELLKYIGKISKKEFTIKERES